MSKFEWTEEPKEAFESLKAYLTSSPVLTPPKKHEDMMLYIAATSMVVSSAIIMEREEGRMYKVQWPIYYISEVLSDSKIRYPRVQKLLYALLITSRKLRYYFESHKITVCRRNLVGCLPRGMPKVVICRQTGVQAMN
jgi:hypothetical protein